MWPISSGLPFIIFSGFVPHLAMPGLTLALNSGIASGSALRDPFVDHVELGPPV